MPKNGSYVRMNLGGDPPRYKYGELVLDPFNQGSKRWYLKSDAPNGNGYGYQLLGEQTIKERLQEITAQDYFLLKLKKPPDQR